MFIVQSLLLLFSDENVNLKKQKITVFFSLMNDGFILCTISGCRRRGIPRLCGRGLPEFPGGSRCAQDHGKEFPPWISWRSGTLFPAEAANVPAMTARRPFRRVFCRMERIRKYGIRSGAGLRETDMPKNRSRGIRRDSEAVSARR